jgi:hypothetical protein
MFLEPHLTTYHSNMCRCPIKRDKPELSTSTFTLQVQREYVLKRSWSLWGCQVAPNARQLAQLCRQPVCLVFSPWEAHNKRNTYVSFRWRKMQLMCDFNKSRAYWWSSLFGTRSSRIWANQPTHFVPCWMPKPLLPRNQCTGGFTPARLKGHRGDLYQLDLHIKSCVVYSKYMVKHQYYRASPNLVMVIGSAHLLAPILHT